MRFKLYRQHGALNSPEIFNAFQQGLLAQGHQVVDSNEDVAVIWSVLWNGRMAPNQHIYEKCVRENKPILIIEVGNLLRNTTWRICLNHINGLGEFGVEENLDPDRPKKLGVKLKPINENRHKEILIATQHQKSLQWKGMPSMADWTLKTIDEIRKYTDRTIVIRPHPRSVFDRTEFLDYEFETPQKISDTYDDFDLKFSYWTTVNYNSAGPAIQSLIQGCPVIVNETSLAYPCSNKYTDLDNPVIPDRTQWYVEIAHTEYTVDEIRSGHWYDRLQWAIG